MNLSCERAADGELFNCQCNDAQRRVDSGQIECGADLCPDDCEVCKFCLYYVVDCHSHVPSMSPSAIPSLTPSLNLSVSPSLVPSYKPSSRFSETPSSIASLRPNSRPSDNPTQLASDSPSETPTNFISNIPSSSPSFTPFDLSDCGSYSNKWFLELAGSCETSPTGERINCVCPDAQRLVNNGQIDCSVPGKKCPDNCDVCDICLNEGLEKPCQPDPSSQPSYSPFDLSVCGSYSNNW